MRGVPHPAGTRGGWSAARRSLPVLARPSTWLLLAAYVIGGLAIVEMLGARFADFPVATITSVVLFTLYAVPFVILVRMIDYLEREPLPLQVMAVLWGALVATATATRGGSAVQDLMAKADSPLLAAAWGQAVSGASVEELVKVAGVVAIALVAPGRINSAVNGFVYGALVGLGFQLVENVAFAINAVALDQGTDAIGPVLVTFFVRGFLGGLWSHTLFTALAGAGVAYALARRDRPVPQRCAVAAVLFLTAAGFHFLWNSPLLSDVRPGLLGVAATILVKGVPALLVGVALIVAAERREADYYAGLLAGLADHRIATTQEITNLVSPHRRLAERRRARVRLGRAGGRAVRRLQRAQARLAVALSRDPGAKVLLRRREVLRRRHQLLALSLRRMSAGPGRSRTQEL
jgi:RsiW-degrading membrane proteinase PrsW (M82 family)